MRAGQSSDNAAHKALVVPEVKPPVDMHDAIVPCRNLTMKLVLVGIPARRYVGITSTKNYESLVAVSRFFPQRIGSCNVRKKLLAVARFVDQKWHMIGIQAVRAVHDQGPEGMRCDRSQQFLGASFFEVVW